VPNNGTIRLPFTTDGLHSDHDAPLLDIPEDFPDKGPGPSVSTSAMVVVASSLSAAAVSSSASVSGGSAAILPSASAVPEKDADGDGDGDKKPASIWDWIEDSWVELKDRLKGIFGGTEKKPE
jgi:hypothetical protein